MRYILGYFVGDVVGQCVRITVGLKSSHKNDLVGIFVGNTLCCNVGVDTVGSVVGYQDVIIYFELSPGNI